MGIFPQPGLKTGHTHIQAPQAVVTGSQVEFLSPPAKGEGGVQIGVLQTIGLLLDKSISILGKTAGGGVKEALVVGNLLQDLGKRLQRQRIGIQELEGEASIALVAQDLGANARRGG